jgi:hypothetical protein
VRIVIRPIHALLPAALAAGWLFWPAPPPAAAVGGTVDLPEAHGVKLKAAGFIAALLTAMPQGEEDDAPPAAWTPDIGRLAAQYAREGLSHEPWGFRDDCSGFASWVYSSSGVPMDGRVRTLFDLAVEGESLHWNPIPRVGDLVFFDDTHDRDENGLWDDDLTHIGVIIDIEPDGTARFAHGGTAVGRTTGTINLLRPDDHVDDNGKVINSYLREPKGYDDPDSTYLAGELWAAFASVDPTKNWLDDE